MKYITVKQIRTLNPCTNQFRAFARFMGKRKRVAVSVALATKLAQRFDFGWLAVRTLTGATLANYRRATAAASADYRRATAAASADYRRAAAAAFANSWRAKAAASADYRRAVAAASADYRRAVAAAWARCYLGQRPPQ